jgi:hypothetical protein
VDEWFADVNVVNRVPHGGGGVIVWAGISYRQQTQLHFIDGNLNAQKYCEEILRPIFKKGICDQQMHICILSHVNSMD